MKKFNKWVRIILLKIALLIVILALSGCPYYVDYDSPSLEAEKIISFKENTYACADESSFKDSIKHMTYKEETKLNAMFNDFTCIRIPLDEKFKVLSVDGEYFEFTNVKNETSSEGFWSDSSFVEKIIN